MVKWLKKIAIFKDISEGVWGVSIACMLIAVSTSMVFSISPLFITKALGLSMLSMGMIEGFSEGLAQLSKLVSSYTGDFFKRKKIPLMVGAVMATISKPMFILANGAGMVIMSKVIERISNGVMATPRDAYIADASSDKTRGNAFGLMMSLKTLGCVIGSFFLAALTYITKYLNQNEVMSADNYRLLLWFGFIPCLLSVFVLVRYMKENPSIIKEGQLKAPEKKANISLTDLKKLNPRYWSLIGVATLFMSARFSDGFLIIRLDNLDAPEWVSTSVIGIFNLVSALSCLPIGRISDRINRSKMLYFSFVTLVLSNLCFLVDNLAIALIGVIMWGAQRGTSQVLFSAIIGDEAPMKIIGTAMGIFYLLTGVIAVFAGMAAGHLADISIKYAFAFGLGMSFIALLFLIGHNHYFYRPKPQKENGPLQKKELKNISTPALPRS